MGEVTCAMIRNQNGYSIQKTENVARPDFHQPRSDFGQFELTKDLYR